MEQTSPATTGCTCRGGGAGSSSGGAEVSTEKMGFRYTLRWAQRGAPPVGCGSGDRGVISGRGREAFTGGYREDCARPGGGSKGAAAVAARLWWRRMGMAAGGQQPSSTLVKEGSIVRPKGTTLECAICDFQKIVALCRPPRLDIQEDNSQGVKRRLPQEVNQKLAKVAGLSRNMREMVELGLSVKQQKADRYQQIKQELNEMIQRRISLLKSKVAEQQDGSADDFQEVKDNEENKDVRKYDMDTALEDKICVL